MAIESNSTSLPYVLRPATPDDEPFLFDLYRTTRTDGQGAIQLDDGGVLLRIQYLGQQKSYEAQFPTLKHDIILVDGRTAGRVMVAPQESEVRFVDLALLPEYRNLGIATVLIRELMNEVARVGKPARMHVARDNRARRLYERLGFEVVGENDSSYVMRWTPETTDSQGE